MIAFSDFGADTVSWCLVQHSPHRLMDNVMPMQIGKNGVNGPAQNIKQADDMIEAHFQPDNIWSK